MLNHIIEIDLLKMEGSARIRKTLLITARRMDPRLLDKPHDASISSVGLPTLSRSIDNILYGASSISYGQLVLDNGDGRYNSYISEGWILENRPCRIYLGDSTENKAAFSLILSCRTGEVAATASQITFNLNDGSLDLSMFTYPAQENATSTIQNAIETIIDIAGCEIEASVTEWLAVHGAVTILLNFSETPLLTILDALTTPYLTCYGFASSGALYFKNFELPGESSTPVFTFTGRRTLRTYSRSGINRLYWKIIAQYWTLDGSAYTANDVYSRDALALTGATTSIADGTKTGIPVVGHGWAVGDSVRISNDAAYQSVYYVQEETTTDVVVINKAYEAHTFSDAYIRNTTAYPFADSNYSIGGLFLVEADAQEAADLWLDFYKVPRYKYTIPTKKQLLNGLELKLGDHIRIELPQPYGTVNGLLCSYEESISDDTLSLGVLV